MCRLSGRVARRVVVEVLDAQVVIKQIRDTAFETVQLRERVLANRDHEVDGQVGVIYGARELDGKSPSAVFLAVVEKILLKLVEYYQHATADAFRRRLQYVCEVAIG